MSVPSVIVIGDTGINTSVNRNGAFGLDGECNEKDRDEKRIFKYFHFDYLLSLEKVVSRDNHEEHDRSGALNDFHRVDGGDTGYKDEAAAERRTESTERA